MTNKVQKVAVFGGSFDPVTNAHISVIKNLSKKFSRVVVLPCRISPFKQDGCTASGEERVAMLRKVTAELENVKVSKWEIKRETVSYTADAIRHYREKYENAEIHFVIGSDCLAGLPDWKDADYLAANAVFTLVRRPGYSVSKKVMENLRELGFNIKSAGFKGEEGSSSLVRAAVAFGKEEDFVPKEIAEYIKERSLYTEYVPFVKAFSVFGMKTERIEHTFRAVKEGIRLCKIYGEDVHEVITALILHDIGKYADLETLEKHKVRCERYGEISVTAPQVLHAHVSAAIARDYFKLNDRIVSAIRKHTTGDEEMSMLDKIVYLADAAEEGRDYAGAKSLRSLASRDIDKAMLRALRATIRKVKEEKRMLCVDTALACKKFAERVKAKKDALAAAPVFAEKNERLAKTEIKPKTNRQSDEKFADLKSKGGRMLAEFIAEKLSEKKGRDIVIIDVAQKTVLADCFVIAGANSATAVKAMADYVDEKLSKDHGIEPLRRDISPKWAALDYGDVIVHVQHAEAREFYRLEKLWDNGDNVTRFND